MEFNSFIPQFDLMESSKLGTEVIIKFRESESNNRTFSKEQVGLNYEDSIGRLFYEKKVVHIAPLFDGSTSKSFKYNSILGENSFGSVTLEEQSLSNLSGLNVMEFVNAREAAAAAIELSLSENVEFAYIPPIKKFAAIDPHQNRQWGLRSIKYFQATTVNGYNDAKNVKIAVLDSGIDNQHIDLKGVFVINKNFSTLVDYDDSGHGTHVTGIIAAITNNGIGISGVCSSDQLMVLRGLTVPYQAKAYYNAVRFAISNNAQVLNCSLGGSYDPTEALLMKSAISNGVIVIAAMGNDFLKGNPTSYPAALPDVIAVGAHDEFDRRANFSQTGDHIFISAPGTNIISTIPNYTIPLSNHIEYDSWDGTSMATPFVTGAVALLMSKNPSLKLTDIKDILKKSARRSIQGHSIDLGYGCLDIHRAISLA